MEKLLVYLVSLIFTAGLLGCDNKQDNINAQEKKVIKLGTSPGPYSELFLKAIKPILEKDGYEIKTIDFSVLRQADIALNDEDIDINVDQHTAYYQDFNKSSGADLIGITKIPTVPTGIYSSRKKSLSLVSKGDKVAIPQDPSNTARAYALLKKAGWITLKKGTVITKASANDIDENKKDIDIIEIDSSTIPRTLADVEYAIIPGSVAYSANIDIGESLLQEDILDHLILVATVKEKNKDTPWAKAIVAAYHSEDFKNYIKENNKNNYWFIPDELK